MLLPPWCGERTFAIQIRLYQPHLSEQAKKGRKTDFTYWHTFFRSVPLSVAAAAAAAAVALLPSPPMYFNYAYCKLFLWFWKDTARKLDFASVSFGCSINDLYL